MNLSYKNYYKNFINVLFIITKKRNTFCNIRLSELKSIYIMKYYATIKKIKLYIEAWKDT